MGLLLTSGSKKNGTAISGEALKSFLKTLSVSYQEYEEIIEEKKLPVLNIFLGIVIAVLLLTVIGRLLKRRSVQDKEADKSKSELSKNTRIEKTQTGKKMAEKQPDFEKNINASLEYPSEKRLVIIQKAMFVIGRTQEADFILSENKGISRKHACIQLEGKSFYLMDLHSTNHTFLNGWELIPGEKRLLRDGDVIMVGKERMVFRVRL